MEPELLYHFTSLDTFFNIIKNKEFRLYDITKSNDPLEGTYVLKGLHESYENMYREDRVDRSKWLFMHQACFFFEEDLVHYGRSKDFCGAASFCVPTHELALLRSYGDNGRGVALGFPTSILKSITSLPDVEFKKVQYLSKQDLLKECDSFWERILQKYYKTGTHFTEAMYTPIITEIKAFYRNGYFIKNDINKDEEEYRLLVYKEDLFYPYLPGLGEKVDDNIDFYSGNGDLKAYYRVALEESAEKGFCLTDVILGPQCKTTITEIAAFLRKYGFFQASILHNTWAIMR